ncbi:MAG: hypothetical protein GZ088_04140 [Acidipila sp.]|nr:hypothetical protein [Acidipila sp.]
MCGYRKVAALRALMLSVCFPFLTASLSAQEITTPVEPTPVSQKAATCSIAGVVVRAGTEEPIRKAQVLVYTAGEHTRGYSATTDDAGRFFLEGIAPGNYELKVDRTGFVTETVGVDPSNGHRVNLALDAGKKISNLLVRMPVWAVISGRITDQDGDPVANAEVVALQSYVDEGQRKFSPSQTALTNDLGEYRLYGLAKGRYYVRAEYTQSSPSTTVYAPIFYPGTVDVSRASTVTLASGQELPSVDFRLVATRAMRIRGHVYSAIPGKGHCCVYLKSRDNTSGTNAFPGPGYPFGIKGGFEIDNVPPGSYFVIAVAWGQKALHAAPVPVEVSNANLEDINLTLSPGVEVTGRITVENGESFDRSTLQFLLTPKDGEYPRAEAEVRRDGTFHFADVALGSYEFNVLVKPPGAYLKSARINGEDILNRNLEIGTEGSHGPLEVVISLGGYQLDGTVADADGLLVAGATVVLIPEGNRRKLYLLYKDVVTDQNGKFILQGIAPGDYKVFAWQGVQNDEWQDPEFLKPFESRGVEVRAEENGHGSVTLKVSAGAARELP